MYVPSEHLLSYHAQMRWDQGGQLAVCAAIRPNGRDFIPVTARPVDWCEQGTDVTEYIDDAGNIWGSLTVLEPDAQSPAWRIDPVAGKDSAYYENSYAVHGDGWMDIWYNGNYVVGGCRKMLTAASEQPVHALPGDTYRWRAGELGLAVLSLYPSQPFEDVYSEQVSVPDVPILPKP